MSKRREAGHRMPISTPRLESAIVVSREFRPPGFWCVRLRCDHVARRARPAQFVALDLPGGFAVRLPLGIFAVHEDTFSLLFQEWGERTARLGALREGDAVSCIGPLGNAFSLPPKGGRATIVAGGLGVAAFWMLARDLRGAGVETTIVLGARSKAALLGEQDLRGFGFPIELCTDDGSEGFCGNVVERVASLPKADLIYGCGPRAMLRALCGFANSAGVRCEISMEETFGCSLGTCWGCIVPVRRGSPQGTGYPRAASERREFDVARVCRDGTVFAAADVVWSA
jgi:dihydroorotate dehydrogenase electron transfer subunit